MDVHDGAKRAPPTPPPVTATPPRRPKTARRLQFFVHPRFPTWGSTLRGLRGGGKNGPVETGWAPGAGAAGRRELGRETAADAGDAVKEPLGDRAAATGDSDVLDLVEKVWTASRPLPLGGVEPPDDDDDAPAREPLQVSVCGTSGVYDRRILRDMSSAAVGPGSRFVRKEASLGALAISSGAGKYVGYVRRMQSQRWPLL